MKRKMSFINLFSFYFLVIILSILFGCQTTELTTKKQDKIPLLSQKIELLKNYNGKIVSVKQIYVDSKWSNETKIYRIKYISDDLEIVGFVVKPRNDKVLPAIIYNRGGNREFGKVENGTLRYLSYLSSNGYVVVASQYRGNDGGEGREEFGGKDVDDVLNIIDLAKSLPFVNPEKIAMLGASRGGMMTYLAIKNGADIKVAAVVGGVTDLEQNYNEREEAMKNVIMDLVGSDKSEWQKRSAVYWPEMIDVPILILHGDKDWRVNVSQAKKLSEGLSAAGKNHRLVIVKDGDHGLNTHRAERNKEIFAWFDAYLN